MAPSPASPASSPLQQHQLPLALSALGGMALFLREGMLDRAVLSLGRMDLLPGTQVGRKRERGQGREEYSGRETFPDSVSYLAFLVPSPGQVIRSDYLLYIHRCVIS